MATILRVKRRYDDVPLDALVVACKKRKTESPLDLAAAESDIPLTTVAKFAGTVQNQEDVLEHLAKNLTKDQLKANYKQHSSDIINKARQQTKEDSKDNRYRVINCFRSIGSVNNEEIDDNQMTVIDVEDSVSCQKPATENEVTEYVYDLYFSQTDEKVAVDDQFDVRPLELELVFDNSTDVFGQADADSDDSNSESNWRNEYPDSDTSENAVTYDDMVEAVHRCHIDDSDSTDDPDPYSDGEDNPLAYCVDVNDVNLYGWKYARYKARLRDERSSNSDESECSGLAITEIHSDEEVDESSSMNEACVTEQL